MAGELAATVRADLTRGTSPGTSPTVSIISFEVNAFTATLGETALARELALAVGADLTSRTSVAACSTMGEVGFEVDADVAALGKSRLARNFICLRRSVVLWDKLFHIDHSAYDHFVD